MISNPIFENTTRHSVTLDRTLGDFRICFEKRQNQDQIKADGTSSISNKKVSTPEFKLVK